MTNFNEAHRTAGRIRFYLHKNNSRRAYDSFLIKFSSQSFLDHKIFLRNETSSCKTTKKNVIKLQQWVCLEQPVTWKRFAGFSLRSSVQWNLRHTEINMTLLPPMAALSPFQRKVDLCWLHQPRYNKQD